MTLRLSDDKTIWTSVKEILTIVEWYCRLRCRKFDLCVKKSSLLLMFVMFSTPLLYLIKMPRQNRPDAIGRKWKTSSPNKTNKQNNCLRHDCIRTDYTIWKWTRRTTRPCSHHHSIAVIALSSPVNYDNTLLLPAIAWIFLSAFFCGDER